MTETQDVRPHSRACGIRKHDHGTACHSNCPTCGGQPTAKVESVMVPLASVRRILNRGDEGSSPPQYDLEILRSLLPEAVEHHIADMKPGTEFEAQPLGATEFYPLQVNDDRTKVYVMDGGSSWFRAWDIDEATIRDVRQP